MIFVVILKTLVQLDHLDRRDRRGLKLGVYKFEIDETRGSQSM